MNWLKMVGQVENLSDPLQKKAYKTRKIEADKSSRLVEKNNPIELCGKW